MSKTDSYATKVENTNKSNYYKILWDTSYHTNQHYNEISQCCMDLVSMILSKNFLIENVGDYLTDLFKNQEVNERLSVVLNHKSFLKNVLGDSPKLIFRNWSKQGTKKVAFIREKPFISEISIKKKTANKNAKKKGEIEDLTKIPHNKRKVISIIDNNLWDGAGWKGLGVFGASNGIALILGFENIEFGNKIFNNWIERFGAKDLDNRIKISIVTDIDSSNPYWYKVILSSNFKGLVMDEDSVFVASVRFHLMNATTNRNILVLKEGLKRFNTFRIHPGRMREDFSMKVNFELFLEKTDITFVSKNEIKEHDIEYVAIMNDKK